MTNIMTMTQLVEEVMLWGYSKGIVQKASTDKQLLKGIEELTEISEALYANDRAEVIDGIGDLLVTQIMYMEIANIDSYNSISIALEDVEPMSSFVEGVTIEMLISHLSIAFGKVVTADLKYPDDSELAITTQVIDLANLLACIALEIGSTLQECLQAAYDVIKHRKGAMVDGVFVKEVA